MAASSVVFTCSFGPNLRHFRTSIILKKHFSLQSCRSIYQGKLNTHRKASNLEFITKFKPHLTYNAQTIRWTTRQTENYEPSAATDDVTDPFHVAKDDLATLIPDIRKELNARQPELKSLAEYYFDGHGKFIRPITVVLMARALNTTINQCKKHLLPVQRQIALICEMIHTATLVHDDVIDISNTRRGKASINTVWGQRKAILGGDYILSSAAQMVARIRNDDVTALFGEVLIDLVQGELMQLGAKERENDRFTHYLCKNFKKTASLIAHSCKATAILGGADADLQQVAFDYGKNIGVAFQLIDDVLDFESTSAVLGKPTAVDLKLGLATAPVLFACEKFPELNAMIMRRFSKPGDVERALEAVSQSNGIQQTRFLAGTHCKEAIKLANNLSSCIEQRALCVLPGIVLNRIK
uniref:All trans-polyprenyl-diphosphate synthase PDSS1 n=1 Tax=Strigamia maritima TaxID=126957 RepID=T1IUZ9_STRMM